jgi:hypothetical protein
LFPTTMTTASAPAASLKFAIHSSRLSNIVRFTTSKTAIAPGSRGSIRGRASGNALAPAHPSPG